MPSPTKSTRSRSHGNRGIEEAWNRLIPWRIAVVAGLSCLLGAGAAVMGLPAPFLLAALMVGMALALSLRDPIKMPGSVHRIAQAMVGVIMGSYLAPGALQSVASSVLPLVSVTVATVVLSMLAAYALKLTGLISLPSAALGMAPGGSAAVVAAADEMQADARTVAFAQYLRVALVALSAPLVVYSVHPSSSSHVVVRSAIDLSVGPTSLGGTVGLAGIVIAGMWAGPRLRLPAPALIGPMLLAGLATATGLVHGFEPSGLLRDVVFTLVGLEVGLRFTRQSLVHVRRLLVPVLAATLAVSVGCAALAWWLAQLVHIPVMDAYLATTPGGINAVLAVAAATHANLPLISSVQGLRLFGVVLATPPLLRLGKWWLSRSVWDQGTRDAEARVVHR